DLMSEGSGTRITSRFFGARFRMCLGAIEHAVPSGNGAMMFVAFAIVSCTPNLFGIGKGCGTSIKRFLRRSDGSARRCSPSLSNWIDFPTCIRTGAVGSRRRFAPKWAELEVWERDNLGRIGLPRQYRARNPFPWMSETIDLGKEKNFFESRVTEYRS